MKTLPRLTCSLLAVVAGASMARAGDAWEVKLDRAFKKGAKFTIESHLESAEENAFGDKVDKPRMTIDLKGTIEVTAIDAKGKIATATCKVEKCTAAKNDEAAAEALPAGHVITLTCKGGKVEVALGKDGLDSKVAELLVKFAPWETFDAAQCDDAVLGTKDKKKAGDTWALDGAQVIARLKLSRKETMDVAKVKATGKLAGPSEVNGVKCLEYEFEVTIPDVDGPGHMAQFNRESSGITWTIKKTVPVDAALAWVEVSDTLDKKQTLKGNMGGGDMTMVMNEKITRSIKLKPAK